MVEKPLERLFPNLSWTFYEVTSPQEANYNCIAWAAGDTSRWWWPDDFGQYYWPGGALRSATMDSFVQAFETLGFSTCKDAAVEPGLEKIAIFEGPDGKPSHAARQLPDGTWTSKLGQLEDITHAALDDVSGTEYGAPAVILCRLRR